MTTESFKALTERNGIKFRADMRKPVEILQQHAAAFGLPYQPAG